MSTINDNERRTPRMRLRSATRRQIARQNLPSVIARRTLALETRRTNLANKIRELEADLREQREALAALTIEVDLALSRREDEKDHYEDVKQERDKLKYTILENFNQSDLGMEYRELQKRYHEYVYNEDEDTDINYFNNFKPRFDYVSSIFEELMETGMAPIKAEKKIAKRIYKAASKHHYTLYQQQQELKGIISNLERELETALIRDRELNQAHGKKRQRNFTHKKGKKGKKGGAWSLKYKRSINCKRPRGFSQKQHCKYGKK